ncbi:MAG: zinc ribbon domain-containing protein [Candidatus Marinimicrobia bacterium]|jgi:putative FmdB family regulatory protein|nr:zinc ribbon domain-containing protein [Candidatus Neomarinimicrobiota bacterium]
MPVYDYRCESCGNRFDELVSFSKSDSEIECPKCSEKKSKRMLSAPSISTNEHSAASSNSCGAPSGFS